jgi:acetylornithine/succinyldiaminopimelate/putrescine aminotransferase
MDQNELKFIAQVHDEAVERVLASLDEYTDGALKAATESVDVIKAEHEILRKKYLQALTDAAKLSKLALDGKNENKNRVTSNNEVLNSYKQRISTLMPEAARSWIMDGPIFKGHTAGIKRLVGLADGEDMLLDVLTSASSISLGAENPWLVMMDRYEDHLGIRDNICAAYHAGLRQGFGFENLAKLYPGKAKEGELKVLTESSGTIVDSAAIESVVAFAEKSNKSDKMLRVLAVDGTWCGGYGTAREATGFGISDYQKKRMGQNIWVDRCLPAPSKEQGEEFLRIVAEKIANNEVAGLYLEPDIIGDLGIIEVDPEVLKKTLEMLAEKRLPIILDCVQQLGRTGSYWGENVTTLFGDYDLVVVTTAKSASNGQPFGYTIMPKVISDSAHPLSQVTTNTSNGPLLRAILVSEILSDQRFQDWFMQKGKRIEEIASEVGFEVGNKGLRGKYLNRSIYVGSNENVKLIQVALLMQDGILSGALPESMRYQPMLFELSSTNEQVARAIFARIQKVQAGDVPDYVMKVHELLKNEVSGLARTATVIE